MLLLYIFFRFIFNLIIITSTNLSLNYYFFRFFLSLELLILNSLLLHLMILFILSQGKYSGFKNLIINF